MLSIQTMLTPKQKQLQLKKKISHIFYEAYAKVTAYQSISNKARNQVIDQLLCCLSPVYRMMLQFLHMHRISAHMHITPDSKQSYLNSQNTT